MPGSAPLAVVSDRSCGGASAPERDLLCRILRGEPARWPDAAAADAAFQRRFLDACTGEGVAGLISEAIHGRSDWPGAVRERLLRDARMHAASDLVREHELIAVLAALDRAKVGTVLLKGAALAYTHYPQPSLRTRCDTDLLIDAVDRPRATRVLQALGYRRPNAVSGTLVSYEETHARRVGGVDCVIDLHWQVNNAQVFAQALGCAEARARSVPVPALGVAARALGPAHALLLACMHRAAHLGADGPGGDRLVWLYDVHLLAAAMTVAQWSEFARLCVERRMCAVALDAFLHAQAALATALPPDVAKRLAAPARAEPSAAYLASGRARLFVADLRALGTWRARATLMRESLVPPSDYVLAKYRSRNRWLLPWWYLRRAAEGVGRWAKG